MTNIEIAVICFGTFCLSLSCIFFTEISTWLRNKIHKKVQCWFCHVTYRVKYIDSNSWTCPSCSQYNGFTKDGDYNKDIPGQYDDRLNINSGVFHRKSSFKRENALCSQCNYNQELKIKQLANFIPIDESKYDKEIEHYRLQLEESYRLCKKCEKLVGCVISSQKYILPGPRRLVHLTKALVFKSCWTLYGSMILSLLVIINRIPSLIALPLDWLVLNNAMAYLTYPYTSQTLAGLGVLLHTVQCCQFGTYWSFINWLVWASVASSPHFLHNQLPLHVSYVQVTISLSLFLSSVIIVVRRKKHELSTRLKEELRAERRKKENATASWTSYNSQLNGTLENSIIIKKSSPIKLPSSSPKSVASVDKINLLKPVAKVAGSEKNNDDLDISNLSIGSKYDNPFAKGAYAPSPWERVTFTRPASNLTSGVSSLRSSPLGWKPNQTLRGSPEMSYTKQPLRSSPTTVDNDWTKSPTLNLFKEPNLKHQSDSWTALMRNQWDAASSFDHHADWELKKTLPMQIYSYPVAYAWPGVVTPWDQHLRGSPSVSTTPHPRESLNDKRNGILVNSLPTIILAATNAILVYYILNTKT